VYVCHFFSVFLRCQWALQALACLQWLFVNKFNSIQLGIPYNNPYRILQCIQKMWVFIRMKLPYFVKTFNVFVTWLETICIRMFNHLHFHQTCIRSLQRFDAFYKFSLPQCLTLLYDDERLQYTVAGALFPCWFLISVTCACQPYHLPCWVITFLCSWVLLRNHVIRNMNICQARKNMLEYLRHICSRHIIVVCTC